MSYLFVLNCRCESFSCFREKLPSNKFNYYKRMSPKQQYPHIKIFQFFPPDSIYLTPHIPLPTNIFLNTLKIKDKRKLSFGAKDSSTDSLSSLLVSIYKYFSLTQKTYPSNHTEVFESEIQEHEMVKSICESVVVL